MAAALLALVALPALAAPGEAKVEDPQGSLTARVYDRVGNATADTGILTTVPDVATVAPEATKRGRDAYVSNQWNAYNLVSFQLSRTSGNEINTSTPQNFVMVDNNNTPDDTSDDTYSIRVRPGGGSSTPVPVTIAGTPTAISALSGYFYVVERETTTDNLSRDALEITELPDTAVDYASETNYDALVEAAVAAAKTIDTGYGPDPDDGTAGPFTNNMLDTAGEREAYDAVISAAIDTINDREVEAGHGDTITISSGSYPVTLVVDGRAPEIDSISPANNALQSSGNVTIGFTVTDNDSGLRSDREAVADTDGAVTGGDGDGDLDNASNEPLSRQYGYTQDIALYFTEGELTVTSPDFTATATSERLDSLGSQNWFELVQDRSYQVEVRRAGLGSENHEWYIAARDRVGNVRQTDSDLDKTGRQPFTLKIDAINPDAGGRIYAGIGFNTANDKRTETRDSSSILVLFSNEANGIVHDTVQADDFVVEDNTVVGVIHPNKKVSTSDEDGDGTKDTCKSDTGIIEPGSIDDCIDTRNRVYLQLGSELADDATPRVQVLGGAVRDPAGNGNNAVEEDATDKIVPTITAVVSGDVSGAGGRPLAMEDITVTVSTGERLQSNPQAWLVAVDANGKIAGNPVRRTLNPVRGSTTSWESDFSVSDVNGSTQAKGALAAVIVFAEDRLENVSYTTGWKGDANSGPASGDTLDLAKLGGAVLLAEFDSNIDPADPKINPDTNTEDDELVTESRNPFIELTFSEGSEYKAENVTGDNPATMDETETDFVVKEGKTKIVIQGKDDVKVDSYAGVWITAITLNDMDVSGSLEEIDTGVFSLALAGLAVDDYTIAYTAKDSAGNEDDFEVNFEVIARRPYVVDLRPGWNLISLPANPADTSIGSVLPSDHPARSVLSYQNGEWVTATRDAETGEWAGTLTDITAGHGYFIETTGFEDLSTAIPEADPSSLLPVVSVVQGWNLIGIVDTEQKKDKTPLPGTADDYFASIEWSVAYHFDTQTSRWVKITKGTAANPSSDQVQTGVGYWVWVTKAGTLVP